MCAYEFCKRPFKRLEHLKRHVRTHTQERPFKCSKCARAFARQDNLTQHIRIHGHGRVDEISHNSGLGLGTPPPREGVDYYVTIAGANGQMPLDRWKTASPAGDGYAGGNGKCVGVCSRIEPRADLQQVAAVPSVWKHAAANFALLVSLFHRSSRLGH